MKWRYLLNIIRDEPVFSSSLLLVGGISQENLRTQLSRWVRAGKLIQLRRGLYTLAEPYRKVTPHAFLIANRLRRASYASAQTALAYYGLIPEYVPTVTSATTGRPEQVENALGTFVFKHLKPSFFHGFIQVEIEKGQYAFIATPEKSLLDLIYLTPGADKRDYLAELRLGNLDILDLNALREMARASGSPKLQRAVHHVAELAETEAYVPL